MVRIFGYRTSGRLTVIGYHSEITSKDAYMLVYTRKNACISRDCTALHEFSSTKDTNCNGHGHTLQETPTPPPARVLDVVNSLNAAHDQACEEFSAK